MGRRIVVTAEKVVAQAELNDSPTADEVWEALPIAARGNTWGDEIYFTIPVAHEQAPDARADVEVGELGYWPVGQAFCIFFGPTPVSSGEKPRAASPVNIIGRVVGDATVFRQVPSGATVTLDKAT